MFTQIKKLTILSLLLVGGTGLLWSEILVEKATGEVIEGIKLTDDKKKIIYSRGQNVKGGEVVREAEMPIFQPFLHGKEFDAVAAYQETRSYYVFEDKNKEKAVTLGAALKELKKAKDDNNQGAQAEARYKIHQCLGMESSLIPWSVAKWTKKLPDKAVMLAGGTGLATLLYLALNRKKISTSGKIITGSVALGAIAACLYNCFAK